MSEDLEAGHPVPTDEPMPAAEHAPVARSRGGGGIAWLIAILALAVAGVALWRVYLIEHGQGIARSAEREQLDARIDTLERGIEQRKRDLESLRARVADVDSVNRSVREELLGLGERSRHLEDAVANLAEQRLSGRDSMAMNEAEFLLQQAQERLALFGDAQAAISAYRLADSALAAAEDPVFASVRQMIGAELQALQASKPVETRAALAALARVRGSLPNLPLRSITVETPDTDSGWRGFLSQFVRISHGGTHAAALDARTAELTRAIVAIDLRTAEAALFARDADSFKAALTRARDGIAAAFDTQSAPVRSDLAELDRLGAMPLAPALPELGSALRELRNLRATRALAQPHAHGATPPAHGTAAAPRVAHEGAG